EIRGGSVDQMGVMSRNRVVRQCFETRNIFANSQVLKCADPYVAGGDTRDQCTGKLGFAVDLLAGGDQRERTGGGDPECVHCLADDVFAHHRAERGTSIAVTRKAGRSRSLQLQVAQLATAVQYLTDEERTTVAKLRHEVAE